MYWNFRWQVTNSFVTVLLAVVYYEDSSVQLLSRVRLFGDSMNLSTPGLPVHHQLPEFTQTHVHRVCDAIQPSHPLSSPSPPAPNPSQHQGLFQWVNSSIGVSALASVLPKNAQDWSPLGWTGILKSLLQHHSSKASVLWCSAFFTVPTLTSIHDHWKSHSLD